MTQVSYVCPSLRQKTDAFRGGLADRWEEAVRHECEYCEITAGFVSSVAEEEATGLPMHAMLTPAAIASLYGEGNRLPGGMRYILNTEISFPHTDRFGRRHPAATLRWDDRVWLTEFVEMLVFISDHIGQPADAIVIHPGKAHGMTFSAIARAMRYIRDAYANACTTVPAVLIQNGYPSLIQSGDDIREFWLSMQAQAPECCDACGVLLDLSALDTAAHHAKAPLSTFLAPLPAESLKGFFLRPADAGPDDVMLWDSIFRGIQMLPYDALIIPDLRHPDETGTMLARCRAGLSTQPDG
ncbi:hypothetical protein [Methanogenium sp. MK-MG]|uniref:hypothetical protein n=1 Tax=Methanogenium sp. MK-MG TaxID=2599926 RepID=UPI0013ED224C|nr:hypothetical protein [Methanogenium sp. MK-MG]KAF1078028.1 hypothetical protein MKMG_01069 [Methanogenium sp. MK-MG]